VYFIPRSWHRFSGRSICFTADIFYRLLPLAGITPPVTPFVLPGLSITTSDWSLPTIDWTRLDSTNHKNGGGSHVLATGKQAAERRTVLPLLAPAFNSSYTVQFFGPTLGCDYANHEQQLEFDYYTARTMNRSGIVTHSEAVYIGDAAKDLNWASGYNGSASLSVYSAFTPNTDSFLHAEDFRLPAPAVNVWPPELPSAFPSPHLQLWFQVANASIVCALANASLDLEVQFLNGVQNVFQRNVTTVNNWSPSIVAYDVDSVYMTTFVALVNILYGNVTLQPAYGIELGLHMDDSNVLNTALSACPEFSFWFNGYGPAVNQTIFGVDLAANLTNYIFPSETWICRNGSLARAIEDLASNMTISMLSNPNPTVNRTRFVSIYTPCSFYQYNNLTLVLSYTTAVVVTLCCVAIGVHALYENGVSHSTSFSAIMNTTHNLHQNEISEGHSLGAEPLAKDLKNMKIRLGIVGYEEETIGSETIIVGHAGFGLEGHVEKLKKGQVCF